MPVTGLEGVVLLVGRVLFGGVIAFMGLNHFMNTDEMAGYSEHKGLPVPRLSVLLSGAVLVVGGLGIMLGLYPRLGAMAVAAFLIMSAVVMHDFWSAPEERQQDEMTQFLKNAVMAGGALTFAVIAGEAWAYSIGLGI